MNDVTPPSGPRDFFALIRSGDTAGVATALAADRSLLDRRNERGHSPVLIAQYQRQREVLAILLEAGPELDIFDASSVGRTGRVAECLDRDPGLVDAYSPDGFFPLGLAAFFAHPETVGLLLARGANVHTVARNPMRLQALHAAVAGGSLEAVTLLTDAGAAVNVQQQGGWAPLHEAVKRNDFALARHLLARGADPRLQSDDGTSAIGLAANKGHRDLLKLLKAGPGDRDS